MDLAHLPPLAFGNHQAKEFRSIAEAADEVRRLIPALIDYEFLDRDHFRFASSFVNVNSLALGAISAQPSRIHVGDRPNPAIGFALAGAARFKAERTHLDAQPAHTAVFVPTGLPTDVKAGARSMVIAQIDPVRLERTAKTMLGLPWDDSRPLMLSGPREISLQLGTVSLDAVFRNLFFQIDAYGANPEMLAYSGIDDNFYRTLAIAMSPDAFIRHAECRRLPAERHRLGRVCEFIAVNLGRRITLTDLERIGHMSRRNLHYSFVNAFGCSPMEWVREQRLLKARGLLLRRDHRISITDVLYDCGFTKASQFSFQYARRFGELPSVTLKRR